jgi:hypothetical protein
MRIGLVPELEMPHLKARSLSWASLRVEGMLSAMHVYWKVSMDGLV